jgi:hypothetical protein
MTSPSDQGRRRCPKITQRPLPDPSAIRLRIVPTTTPPYDDELLPPPPATRTAGPAATPRPDPGRPAPDRPGPVSQRRPAAQQKPAGGPAFATQFAQVLVESLAGTRPPRQLATWTTERAKSRIQHIAPLLAAGQPHPPRLRRVVAHHPAPDVIEMTIIITIGPRTRALAIRLEHISPPCPAPGRPHQPARWVCTEVEAA